MLKCLLLRRFDSFNKTKLRFYDGINNLTSSTLFVTHPRFRTQIKRDPATFIILSNLKFVSTTAFCRRILSTEELPNLRYFSLRGLLSSVALLRTNLSRQLKEGLHLQLHEDKCLP